MQVVGYNSLYWFSGALGLWMVGGGSFPYRALETMVVCGKWLLVTPCFYCVVVFFSLWGLFGLGYD